MSACACAIGLGACASSEPSFAPDPPSTPPAGPPAPTSGPEPMWIVAPQDVGSPPRDGLTTASGLVFKVLASAPAERASWLVAQRTSPGSGDGVRVHYVGWTASGRPFDDVLPPKEPAVLALTALMPGLREALMLMRPGDRLRAWLPATLANAGKDGLPQGMLVYDVALREVLRVPPAPTEPPAFVGPPSAAMPRTASGLVYQRLRQGFGPSPRASQTVTVHYTGWTTDGKMFDSSIPRGEPSSFPVSGVIPGFAEGLQLMQVGSRMRFWIPVDLAYKGRPGAPAGMLLFDVELVSFE